MTALLRKDFYAVGRYSLVLMGLALLFNLLPTLNTLGSTYAILMPFMIPFFSISSDDRCKWDRLAAMLPYRVGQIVWSKYLLSYLCTLAGVAIVLVGTVIRGIREPEAANWGDTAETIFMLLLVMLLMTAAGLPLTYRFGSETGRILVLLLLAVGVGISVTVMGLLFSSASPALFRPALPAAAAAALAGVTYPSYRLSVRLYRRRQDRVYY